MAFPQGINFRATAGFVTDGANEDYWITEVGFGGSSYPVTTAQGNNVGIEGDGANSSHGSRNRNAGNDRRLAGMGFGGAGGGGSAYSFRFDLPAAGDYNIRVAAGDANYAGDVGIELFDTTSSLGTLVSGSTSAANRFKDATNTEYTAANWPGSNTAVLRTFSTTICRFRINPTLGSSDKRFAHLYLEAVIPALTQSRYRWRNDDGSETGATWAAAENTAITLAQNTPRRLRVQVQSTNDKPSASYKLQYRKVGDPGWDDVT